MTEPPSVVHIELEQHTTTTTQKYAYMGTCKNGKYDNVHIYSYNWKSTKKQILLIDKTSSGNKGYVNILIM